MALLATTSRNRQRPFETAASPSSIKLRDESSTVLVSLFEDSDSCDVNIIGTDSDSGVGAHKLVLSAVSPVFKAMFTSQMKESTARDIPVAFSRTVIACLVKFVYLGEVSADSDTLVPLYAAADHYAIEGLVRVCKKHLVNPNIAMNNCFQWYFDSLQWGQLTEELATNFLTFIADHFFKALSSPHFVLLPYEAMLDLLQRRDLAANEIVVFEGVSQWIEGNKGAQNHQAKTLMEHVRYPLISPADLVSKVRPCVHKSMRDYVCALEFHHLPLLDAVTAPQFLPRTKLPLIMPLIPSKVSYNPTASQVVLPRMDLTDSMRANEPVAVLIAKKDCKFTLKNQGSTCSVDWHSYDIKLTNLPTVGTERAESQIMSMSVRDMRRAFAPIGHSFAISGQGSSCVLSRAGTADTRTIEHTFPVMVIFEVSCACMKFTLSTDRD